MVVVQGHYILLLDQRQQRKWICRKLCCFICFLYISLVSKFNLDLRHLPNISLDAHFPLSYRPEIYTFWECGIGSVSKVDSPSCTCGISRVVSQPANSNTAVPIYPGSISRKRHVTPSVSEDPRTNVGYVLNSIQDHLEVERPTFVR